MYIVPCNKLAGNIVARIIPYVGLQLVKIGPSDKPSSTCFILGLFVSEADLLIFVDSAPSPILSAILSHDSGNKKLNPTAITNIPENANQKLVGTPISVVEPLRSIVNAKTDKRRLPMMKNGALRSFVLVDPASTTGRTGSTHGERTVNAPARNANNNSSMLLNSCY